MCGGIFFVLLLVVLVGLSAGFIAVGLAFPLFYLVIAYMQWDLGNKRATRASLLCFTINLVVFAIFWAVLHDEVTNIWSTDEQFLAVCGCFLFQIPVFIFGGRMGMMSDD